MRALCGGGEAGEERMNDILAANMLHLRRRRGGSEDGLMCVGHFTFGISIISDLNMAESR